MKGTVPAPTAVTVLTSRACTFPFPAGTAPPPRLVPSPHPWWIQSLCPLLVEAPQPRWVESCHPQWILTPPEVTVPKPPVVKVLTPGLFSPLPPRWVQSITPGVYIPTHPVGTVPPVGRVTIPLWVQSPPRRVVQLPHPRWVQSATPRWVHSPPPPWVESPGLYLPTAALWLCPPWWRGQLPPGVSHYSHRGLRNLLDGWVVTLPAGGGGPYPPGVGPCTPGGGTLSLVRWGMYLQRGWGLPPRWFWDVHPGEGHCTPTGYFILGCVTTNFRK